MNDEKINKAQSVNQCAARLNAKSAIHEHIQRLNREADGLTALLADLSVMELSPKADEALWALISFRR